MNSSQTSSASTTYNASVEVVKEGVNVRVMRVYPDAPKVRYLGGQYGSLGLKSTVDSAKLIKRAYSISSSIVDLASRRLISPSNTSYYEFYFNRVAQSGCAEQLTPKLFSLRSGDRIFCGTKVVGQYTLLDVEPAHNILLISTTTGEAANNSLINEILLEGRHVKVCHIALGDTGWESMYTAEHRHLGDAHSTYRYKAISMSTYRQVDEMIECFLNDPVTAEGELGLPLDPHLTTLFLCGDPLMIGAPKKRGAWNYEYPDSGLVRLFNACGFELMTRFKRGTIAYESYW